jgi:hypothetical protein
MLSSKHNVGRGEGSKADATLVSVRTTKFPESYNTRVFRMSLLTSTGEHIHILTPLNRSDKTGIL